MKLSETRNRYEAAFGDSSLLMEFWDGSWEELHEAMEQALAKGEAIPTEDLMRTLRGTFYRYEEAFGEMPPLVLWHGFDDELQALMESAIRKGEPISVEEICRAQGVEPPPEGALY